VYSLKRFL